MYFCCVLIRFILCVYVGIVYLCCLYLDVFNVLVMFLL